MGTRYCFRRRTCIIRTFVDDILGIKTYYEQQWLARGLDIKYLKFELQQREQFMEPDVEIELDPYRSFGRSNAAN